MKYRALKNMESSVWIFRSESRYQKALSLFAGTFRLHSGFICMKILFLTSQFPGDLSFGGGQRTTLMHAALEQVGEVTTLVLREGEAAGIKRGGMMSVPAAANPSDVIAEISYPESSFMQKYQHHPVLGKLVREVLDPDDFDVVVGRYLGNLLAMPRFRGLSVVDADDAWYTYPEAEGMVAGGTGEAENVGGNCSEPVSLATC